jgi:hypothetical protein
LPFRSRLAPSLGITLSSKDEEKWLDRFDRLKKEALGIKAAIDSTDKQIDRMVYELYVLTAEEIKIVGV